MLLNSHAFSIIMAMIPTHKYRKRHSDSIHHADETLKIRVCPTIYCEIYCGTISCELSVNTSHATVWFFALTRPYQRNRYLKYKEDCHEPFLQPHLYRVKIIVTTWTLLPRYLYHVYRLSPRVSERCKLTIRIKALIDTLSMTDERKRDRRLLAACNEVANIIYDIVLLARGIENFYRDNITNLTIHHYDRDISQIFNVARVSIE